MPQAGAVRQSQDRSPRPPVVRDTDKASGRAPSPWGRQGGLHDIISACILLPESLPASAESIPACICRQHPCLHPTACICRASLPASLPASAESIPACIPAHTPHWMQCLYFASQLPATSLFGKNTRIPEQRRHIGVLLVFLVLKLSLFFRGADISASLQVFLLHRAHPHGCTSHRDASFNRK